MKYYTHFIRQLALVFVRTAFVVNVPLFFWVIKSIMHDDVQGIVVSACILTPIFVAQVGITLASTLYTGDYVMLNTGDLEVRHPNINNSLYVLKIPYDKISAIEYYKITSLKSWSMIFQGGFPKRVYITYESGGESVTTLVGYLDFKEVVRIAQIKNLPLIMH